jgi:hypothetical protein
MHMLLVLEQCNLRLAQQTTTADSSACPQHLPWAVAEVVTAMVVVDVAATVGELTVVMVGDCLEEEEAAAAAATR